MRKNLVRERKLKFLPFLKKKEILKEKANKIFILLKCKE